MIQIFPNFWITIHVLFTYSKNKDMEGPYHPLYIEIIKEFSPWANFINEDGSVEQI